MDNLPQEVFDDGIRFPSLQLSEDGQKARRANQERNRQVKPLKFRKEKFLEGVAEAFEELGGVARLVQWGDNHYGDFITKVVGKTLPQAIQHMSVHASGPVQIVCPIGQSALDDVQETTDDGKVIDVTPEKSNGDREKVG